MNPAEELNVIIKDKVVYNLLSKKGRAIFFPKQGIISQSLEAKGKEINATIGIAVEKDGTAMRLNSIAERIKLNPQDVFTYASSYGKLELREKWKAEIYRKNPGLEGEISLPIITNGLTHGLSLVGYLFVDAGEEIITTDLFWGNYKLIFEKAYQGKLSFFNTFKKQGFDLAAFKEKLSEKKSKKIVLLNFPNNPTGYTPTKAEAEKIVAIIKERAEAGDKIVVICDDAYFGLFYEDVYQESLFSLLADLHENVLAVKIDGATKESYVWGLRVGMITFAGKGMSIKELQVLEDKTAGAVRGNISNASHLSQSLVLESLRSKSFLKEKKEKFKILEERFTTVKEILKEEKYQEYFTTFPFNSGYFMCLNLKGIDAEQVRQVLLEKYSTGVISLPGMIRVSFSSVPKEKIKKLFENIYKASQKCA
ncbi:MAG: aminotransferase class I/II-fold pyridoxal phosphate-dependent enzyme [Nanoarchaeota archaeon]|nr:aminotransferase class I/II-fold pyridoxal phosphate-dependent enzyme [Nanoarchaeota archaeon]MBU1622064.1 aminotransferase class I/II-fold pyridoxal phosphate-dependent enzyme [Nanoarchaeota archaeon]MBU1974140.1 aminotransferase class I/II-fold pyridoxal phosphate-dependent enzyme [Nanoarchaeota archaeon]